MALS
jgi:hypothetical protein